MMLPPSSARIQSRLGDHFHGDYLLDNCMVDAAGDAWPSSTGNCPSVIPWHVGHDEGVLERAALCRRGAGRAATAVRRLSTRRGLARYGAASAATCRVNFYALLRTVRRLHVEGV